MMYKLLLFISSCFLAFIFGCSENDAEQNISSEEITDIKVYRQQIGEEYEIEEYDSIRIKLRNDYTLCVVSAYDSIAVIYDEEDISVEQVAYDKYLCKPRLTGAIDVLLLGYNVESGTKIQSVREVHFKISGYYENYYIIENSYIVDVVNSEVTKYKILAELQNNCLPEENGLFCFCYTGLEKGGFTYLVSEKTNIAGEFAVDASNYKLTYDTSEFVINIYHKETDYYELKQDLTEKYQLLYPHEEIKQVFFVSTAIKTGD